MSDLVQGLREYRKQLNFLKPDFSYEIDDPGISFLSFFMGSACCKIQNITLLIGYGKSFFNSDDPTNDNLIMEFDYGV